LETFIEPLELVANPNFQEQRKSNLAILENESIDAPIFELIHKINRLRYCFTLQSCFGHFLYKGQVNPNNYEPLPVSKNLTRIEYRIAYIAFCIDDCPFGRSILRTFRKIPLLDPENIQFCCAKWFWKRQVNSYVLQVEPDRYKDRDQITIDYEEALKIEKVRNMFFDQLGAVLKSFNQ